MQADHPFDVDLYVDSLPTDMWTALSEIKKSNANIGSLNIILKSKPVTER